MPCATLTVQEKPQAVIDILSVRVDPSTVYAGDQFTLYVTVQNSGNADGQLNYAILVNGTRITSGAVGPIKAGFKGELNFGKYTAPSSPGTYSICVEKV
jgi:subtilase family serine protease